VRFNKKTLDQILKGVQWPSAAACLTIGILLAATIVQTKIHAPITGSDFSTIHQLIDRNPAEQDLRDEIRALDMLARKAYFTSMHQLRTGTLLFFIALAMFLISWNIRTTLYPPLPPEPGEKRAWWTAQTRSAKTAAMATAVIIAVSITGGVIHKFSSAPAAIPEVVLEEEEIIDTEQFIFWWMNFRGPGGIGVATYTNAPMLFDGEAMAGIRWKTKTPLEGFSSPVVYENRIYLTGGSADSRQVFSFDVEDGRLLWTYDVRVAGDDLEVPKVDRETGYAAPSVACDGRRVYAIFATGELVALTLDGEHVWSKFLGVPDNHYGHSSSLMVHDGILFVQFDQYDTGKLFAINGRTGNVVWEAPREILSWASPIIVNTGSRYELILLDNDFVTSYDPATGTKLWSHDCMHGEVGPSPAFASGLVSVANEYAIAGSIDAANPGEDGVPPMLWRMRGDLPNTASPLSVDSLLFLATATGTVICHNNRDGTILWKHDFDRGFYSSPIAVGNNVFLFDRNGVMHVFEASAEFNLIASSAIGEPVTTTPAVLDGYIIIRGDSYLYRIDGIDISGTGDTDVSEADTDNVDVTDTNSAGGVNNISNAGNVNNTSSVNNTSGTRNARNVANVSNVNTVNNARTVSDESNESGESNEAHWDYEGDY
jgi:outer membrane protein assembly factor BamB